ncbi:MAG TPA: metallophosphatase domain-containing protein [Acidisarcina sp.]|nr:metallophosphatase domain-containing protein [Acidisarcina sp.]
MRVVCISDTHELHRELQIPRGDLLIHAGDFTFFGKSRRKIIEFNDWLGELPHAHKVVVPGNHEFLLEEDPGLARLFTNCILLSNEGIDLAGVKIWGSPMTPHYGGAFGRSNEADRVRIYSSIPNDTDILITHMPPYGILDGTDEYPGPSGDPILRKAVIRVKPRLHVFGHVHAGYGVNPTRDTMFVNAALLGLTGALENKPIVLDIAGLDFNDTERIK